MNGQDNALSKNFDKLHTPHDAEVCFELWKKLEACKCFILSSNFIYWISIGNYCWYDTYDKIPTIASEWRLLTGSGILQTFLEISMIRPRNYGHLPFIAMVVLKLMTISIDPQTSINGIQIYILVVLETDHTTCDSVIKIFHFSVRNRF